MIYIGYITINNKKIPLTYGNEEDMLAWKETNILVQATTELFLLPDGEDPDLCLSDNEYFENLF